MPDPTIRLERSDRTPSNVLFGGDRHTVIHGAFLGTPQHVWAPIDIAIFDTPSVDPDSSPREYADWWSYQLAYLNTWMAKDAVLILLPTDRKGHPWSKSALTASGATAAGWQLFRHFSWHRQDADFHRAQYAFSDIWAYRRGNRGASGTSPIRYKDILRYKAPHDADSQIGAIPVDIQRDLIDLFARGGDTVLDPFAGSGGVMVAANDLGLRSISIELDTDRAADLSLLASKLEGTL